MRKYLNLSTLILVAVVVTTASSREPRPWEPRLAVTGSMSVWSPGATDKELFQTSMGAGLSVMYWINPKTQIIARGTYAPLKGDAEYWYDKWGPDLEELADTVSAFDVFDVVGDLWTISLELRRLYPGGYNNYLYLGIGGDFYYFADVEGDYEIYGTAQPIKGTITDQRDATYAGGVHLSPGLFFIFYKRLFIDAGVRLHFLYDGEDNPYWIEPSFSASFRIF